MAVAPTGAIYKALKFDGVSSRTYGVYITGAAVYNAPERDVEMIAIPGRNGSYALDKGRFENIEVTYPAGIFADAESDFAEAVSDFRNFLCSRNGYVRLQDEYNPNEYRMAVYKSGLEVEPALLRAGEFNIVFECKPQRYLTSGETAVAVTSGDTITNPTLFDARPLLEITGWGDINIGGKTITLHNIVMGRVVLADDIYDYTGVDGTTTKTATATILGNLLDTGDSLYFGFQTQAGITFTRTQGGRDRTVMQSTTGIVSSAMITAYSDYSGSGDPGHYIVRANGQLSFTKGTSETKTGSAEVFMYFGAFYQPTVTISLSASYDGANAITFTQTVSFSDAPSQYLNTSYLMEQLSGFYGDSTLSILGNPIYMDLDIGEAWKIVSGDVVSVNNVTDFTAELPKLAPGSNTITFDNTVTQLKIVPRWWKI